MISPWYGGISLTLYPSYAASTRAGNFLKRARRRIDDRMDIGIRHRGRQCHQAVARGQHAAIEKCAVENRLTPRLLLAHIGRAIVADRAIGEVNLEQRTQAHRAAGYTMTAKRGVDAGAHRLAHRIQPRKGCVVEQL